VRIIRPFIERVPFTQKYLDIAMGVLRDWGLTDKEVGEKLIQIGRELRSNAPYPVKGAEKVVLPRAGTVDY
jgi:hypothetical protein